MTHGVTERNSSLFYWGQSGAMNESISDIMGEIIDHRNAGPGDAPTDWALGEDLPDRRDPQHAGPDPRSATRTRRRARSTSRRPAATLPATTDGVHTNCGVGNKTFYLASQGGTFNGQTITGIDAGDPTLTKSAKL